MPVAMFIGIAAATALFGSERTIHAVKDNETAKIINKHANERVGIAREKLLTQRDKTKDAFNDLAELKINVLNHSIGNFLDTFEKIKNVDFTGSEGLDELRNMKVTKEQFQKLRKLSNFAADFTQGAATGATGGALTAFGAWGLAQSFATASTGTAISSLSGAAASNATLAFFGGGSLASGGLGMTGGAIVLGGLIVGPALAVMGLITAAKAGENLDDALTNKAKSDEIVASLETSSFKCSAIRRRTYLFYNLLTHLDTYFVPLILKMQKIVESEGTDFSTYKRESKKIIAEAASTAVSIKTVIDTPILNEDGALTEESDAVSQKISFLIYADNH